MRVVTRLTGLSADVVRVWERRHHAIEPDRTRGNARRYSSRDIRRLELLRDAVAAGHSIGAIARLPDEILAKLAASAPAPSPSAPFEPYLEAIAALELPRAEAILARHAQLLGPRETVLEFVQPLLREVGDRWHDGRLSVASEHAASAQIRALLSTLARSRSLPVGAPRMVLATPPGQRHELGALMAAVLAAERGVAPVYLGPDLPWDELRRAYIETRAQVVTLSALVTGELARVREDVVALEALARDFEIWVGGPPNHPLLRARGVRAFNDFLSFEAALTHRFGV